MRVLARAVLRLQVREYHDPGERHTNRREAGIARMFPELLPMTGEVVDGCLVARKAAHTIESLARDLN